MEEKEYSVSEAVRLIGVESHVLRYWEEELQIEVRRTSQGHRIYSQENIETFRQAKSLKEKGIQLKAIRVLLEESEKIEKEEELTYEILLSEEKPDNLKQFEAILKRMIEEVVTEQNEKMEHAIANMLRMEIEELYLQYDRIPMKEAAVSSEKIKRKKFSNLFKRVFGKA